MSFNQLEEWGKELLWSLQRAGDHFTHGEVTMHDDCVEVNLYMNYEFPAKAKKPIHAYIRERAKDNGWTVGGVRLEKKPLRLVFTCLPGHGQVPRRTQA
jgi:hypothetical protein